MKALLLLMAVITLNLQAQDNTTSLRGTVVDGKSREPVPYASVYIKGKSVGTATNEEGKFVFHVNSGFLNDTLIVSVIGYSHFKSLVRHMAVKENNIEL